MYSAWLKFPKNFNGFRIILPILMAQVLQRFYPVIDSHYISVMGKNASLINAIQFNFIVLGQLIGMASSISCLTFWGGQSHVKQKKSIVRGHILLVIILMSVIGLVGVFFSNDIIKYFAVNAPNQELAKNYLCLGFFNMVLQALYGTVDGILIAVGKQNKAMFFACILLLYNFIIDALIVNLIYLHGGYPAFDLPLYLISCSTSLGFIITLSLGYISVKDSLSNSQRISIKEILAVWIGEISIYLLRGALPIVYAIQLSRAATAHTLLVTYQLSLQLSYLFCLPLLASLQLAVKKPLQNISKKNGDSIPIWWPDLLYYGLLPSFIFLMIGIIFPRAVLGLIFYYDTPSDQLIFVTLFFFACLVGQIANILTIPIRVNKKNYLITRNFIISELLILIGGTQILLELDIAIPAFLGLITISFVSMQLLLNYLTAKNITIEVAYL